MDDFVAEGCLRNVTRSKYERQNLETYFWWQRLFKIMEDEVQIPRHQKRSVITEIFPKRILKRILKVFSGIQKDDVSREFSTSINSKKGSGTDISIPSQKIDVKFNEIVEEKQTERLEKEENGDLNDNVDMMSEGGILDPKQYYSQQTIKAAGSKRKKAGASNPYMRFFKRNPERVAIWRELPPLKIEEMNLRQKSVAVTEAIAVDFVNWMIKLGGETASKLDVPEVVKMFEIGFNVHAATSLQVVTKELPSITKPLAVSMDQSKKWWCEKLHDEISKDITAYKKPKKWRAFGTSLPKNSRYMPPKTDGTARWLKVNAPEDLLSMRNVWEGITHLRSTRAYCKYLIDNPHLPAPKYLKDLGMLNPEYYLQPHYSIETIDFPDSAEDGNALFFDLTAK